nr:MAG: RNA-dependent RNA polymerase [XiangYun mono-chu-like virus 6]
MFSKLTTKDEEFGQTRSGKFNFYQLITERKLSRALRDSQLKRFQALYENDSPNWTYDDDLILKHIDPEMNLSYEPIAYTELLKQTLNLEVTKNHTSDIITSIYPLIKSLVEHQVTYMQKCNQDRPAYITIMNKLLNWTSSWTKNLRNCTDLIKLLTVGHELTDMVAVMAQIQDIRVKENDYQKYTEEVEKVNKFTIKSLNVDLVWNKQLVLVTFHEFNKQYLAPLDYGLLCCNKIHDLASIMLLTQYGQGIQFPKNAMVILKNFINECIELSFKYQTNFFTIMKSLEGIVNAEILIDVEEWENVEFLMNIHYDLIKDVHFSYLKSKLRRIIRSAPTNYKYELGCLSKIFGHPYVNMSEGSASMFKKAQQYYHIDMDMVIRSVCYMKENFVKNYYARHKKWPPMVTNWGCSKLILHAKLLNIPLNSPSIPSHIREGHTIDSWNFVDLLPCEDFISLESAIPYLKDRTITLLRSTVEEKYLSEEDSQEWVDWRKTRLLLAFLIEPQAALNHQAYIKKYEKSASLEDLLDYLVIRVVPKEKELKVKFRGFGCKTYEDRMRCLAQEKTVTEFLEKYSEDQAMAIDEISLQKKLRTFRNMNVAYEHHKLLYVNIDASSWCSHMRRETIDVALSETLDKIYNTRIFGKTQLAYEKTLIYVPDSEGHEYWDGQLAGIEGLNQESWVTVYIAQIKAALHGLTYKYYILCRGDDLRITFCIPNSDLTNESLMEIKTRILHALKNNMMKVGHEIKIQDSYGSEKFFTFCKQASVNNIELSQSYRKIQKCYGANNAFLETLDEYIAASFSNGHSASKASTTPLPSYCVSAFWAFYDLKRSKHYANLTNAQYIALLLVPSLAGGFPIIYLHNFYVRAESDLLTPFIDLYHHISERDFAVSLVMKNFMYVTKKLPKTFEALYNDPYSLPIARPTLPTGYLRAQMDKPLERITKNEIVKELLTEVKSRRQQTIIKMLDSCNVLHAKPLSVIYQALPKAILGSILKMFENSRSVLQLLCNNRRSMMKYYVQKAYEHEEALQKWRIRTMHKLEKGRSYAHLLDPTCPLKSADDIREFSWGKKVVGVTMPTMAHLYTIVNKDDAPISQFIDNNHFLYTIEDNAQCLANEKSDHYASGTQIPFVGFKTRPGTQMPQMHFVEHNQFLAHIKNMTELNTWFTSEKIVDGKPVVSNISKVVMKIVSLYTQEDPETIIPYVGFRRSGVIEHHLACQGFLSAIVPNVLSNRYTIVKGKSDSHKTLVMQQEKYKLNLLHIYCSVVSILTFELDVSNSIDHRDKDIYVVTTDCPYCTAKIEEYPLRFDEDLIDSIKLRPLKALRVSKEAINIFRRTTAKYENQVLHNLEITRDLSLEVAAMGVLMEDFTTFKSSINTVVGDIGGHVPNIQSYDLLKNMHIHKSSKNTSVTELKAIPANVLATALSQLITDYVLSSNKRIYTIDQLSGLCTNPGHTYPWYKIMEALAHTGVILKVFSILQKATGMKMYGMSSNIADLAVKIVPLAVAYSLYHDRTETKFILVHDLVPEVNTRSFTNSVSRTIMTHIYGMSLNVLDPVKSMRRSVVTDILAYHEIGHFEDLNMSQRTRLEALLHAFLCIFSGYLRRDYIINIPQVSLNQKMTLKELFNEFVTLDDETPDFDEVDLEEIDYMQSKNFNIMFMMEELKDCDEEIKRTKNKAFESERIEHIMNAFAKQSGGRLHSLLTQFCMTESDFLIFMRLVHKDNYLDLRKRIEMNKLECDNLEIEIVSTPIVSCGQRLRREIRTMTHQEQVAREIIIPSTVSVSLPPSGNHALYIRCYQVEDINQPHNIENTLPQRQAEHQYANPKFIMAIRPFGMLTSSYSILMELMVTFKIQPKPLKIYAAGVGYGGDLVFMQNYFSGSQVYVNTLLSGNYSQSALQEYFDPNKEPLTVIDDHLELGYESAFEERSLQKAIIDYGHNIDFFWIDIEYDDSINDEYLFDKMYRLLQYILYTKSLGACIILKVTTKCSLTILMLISILTRNNLSVYPTRPKSQLPCDYIYLVTVGICQASANYVPTLPNTSIPLWSIHYNHVLSIVLQSHEQLRIYQDRNHYVLPTSTKTTMRYGKVIGKTPILWISLLTSKLNYTVHERGIEKMIRHLRPEMYQGVSRKERIRRAYANFVFKYDELHRRQMENLYNPDRGNALDNQAARVLTVKNCLLMTGFHHMHNYLMINGEDGHLTADMFSRSFGNYINTFQYRDTHFDPENPDYKIYERNYRINGVLVNYIESYIEGVNIGICMMGWVNYMYGHLNRGG